MMKLTEGPILKALIALAVPIIGANILQSAYQLVDTFWLGRLGAEAVAAVSLSFPIIFLLISIGGGLAIAGTILVAQYKGSNNQKQVDHVAGQTMVAMLTASIIVTIAGYLLSKPIMVLMGAAPDVLPGATAYLQITFLGIIFFFGYFMFHSLMRGVGDVKTPLYIVLGTVILNIILDPLFIFGYASIPAMGVAGAAVATIISQAVAVTAGMIILLSGRAGIHINSIKPDLKILKKIVKIGIPASLEQSSRAIGFTALTFLAATFSTAVVASFGIGMRIISFVIIPAFGLSMATSTLVGQNIGAKKIDRAQKSATLSIVISFVSLTAVGILLFFFASNVAAFFVPGDTIVIGMSTVFIKIMALSFGILGIQLVLNGVFRGAGMTTVPMILSIISLWIIQFPVALVLSKTSLTHSALWWSFPISIVLTGIITYIWYATGTWKKKKVIDEDIVEATSETMIEEGI
jgi:putative MATE family efflux protein